MIDGGDRFIAFVKQEVASKIDEWYKDYGDEFIESIIDVVNEYTSTMTYE